MKDGALTIDFDGQGAPSNWTGTERARFSLSPVALLSVNENFFNRVLPCSNDERTWSYAKMRGAVEWSAACTDHEACKQHKYALIPRVATDVPFTPNAAGDVPLWEP